MHFLLKSSQALAGKHDLFFPLRPRTSTMLNRGSYHVIAQIFLTLAKMTLALARMGVGVNQYLIHDAIHHQSAYM